jgi:hypothetical protein
MSGVERLDRPELVLPEPVPVDPVVPEVPVVPVVPLDPDPRSALSPVLIALPVSAFCTLDGRLVDDVDGVDGSGLPLLSVNGDVV